MSTQTLLKSLFLGFNTRDEQNPDREEKHNHTASYSISNGGMSLEYLNQTARNGNRSFRKRTGAVYGLQAYGCIKALWEGEKAEQRTCLSHTKVLSPKTSYGGHL